MAGAGSRYNQTGGRPLRQKLVGIFLVSLFLPMALFFFFSIYTLHCLERQVYTDNVSSLRAQTDPLVSFLDSAAMRMDQSAADYYQGTRLDGTDLQTRYSAGIDYVCEMDKDLLRISGLEGIQFISARHGESLFRFAPGSTDFRLREEMQSLLRTVTAEETAAMANRWQLIELEQGPVLVYCASGPYGSYYAWSSLRYLLNTFFRTEDEESAGGYGFGTSDRVLVSNLRAKTGSGAADSGEIKVLAQESFVDAAWREGYILFGSHLRYFVARAEIPEARGVYLFRVIDRGMVLGNIRRMQLAGALILLLVMAVLLPCLLRLLERCVFRPVRQLEEGMRAVEAGELETRVAADGSSKEFSHLADSFNSMVAQIHSLKLDSYESRLRYQQLHMDFLTIQIRPHFFLNALNLINTMSQVGDASMIKEFTELLASYLRYLVGIRGRDVSIAEELAHVSDYIRITRLRFGDCFVYEEEAEQEVLGERIPPLLIQTTVENSIKYALDVYGSSVIRLSVKKKSDSTVITVTDNGRGYSQEIMEALNAGEAPEGEHIGLYNAFERLRLLYGERCSMRVFEAEGGGAGTEYVIDGDKHELTSGR